MAFQFYTEPKFLTTHFMCPHCYSETLAYVHDDDKSFCGNCGEAIKPPIEYLKAKTYQ